MSKKLPKVVTLAFPSPNSRGEAKGLGPNVVEAGEPAQRELTSLEDMLLSALHKLEVRSYAELIRKAEPVKDGEDASQLPFDFAGRPFNSDDLEKVLELNTDYLGDLGVQLNVLERYSEPESVRSIFDMAVGRMNLPETVEVVLDDLCCQVGLDYLNTRGSYKRKVGKVFEDLIADIGNSTPVGDPIVINNRLLRDRLFPRIVQNFTLN